MNITKFKLNFKKNYNNYKKLLQKGKSNDINESDTVDIIASMLVDLFGYDRFEDITREYAIKGTYCDLALKINKKVKMLIEVKAIGIELKENHIRQAVSYGATEGISWIILTNGINWKLFKLVHSDRVQENLVCDIYFDDINLRKESIEIDQMFLISKFGFSKGLVENMFEQQQIVNKYNIGSILMSDKIANAVRSQLKSINSGVKVNNEEVKMIIENEIIKREIIENENTSKFKIKLDRFIKREKTKKSKTKINSGEEKKPIWLKE